MTNHEFYWLTSDDAERHFRWTLDQLKTDRSAIAIQKSLREQIGAAKARAVLHQIQLRQKAKKKFPEADRMFFTDVALQQATSRSVAETKFARFSGNQPTLDLCCGIGGDLLVLAKNSYCRGVDQNPLLCHFAEANVIASGGNATVECDSIENLAMADETWVHFDPGRRNEQGRTTRLEYYQPPLDVLQKVIDQSAGACLKLAPATRTPLEWQTQYELQWIGHEGECKQQLCWSGGLAFHPGRKSVQVIDRDGAHELVQSTDSLAVQPSVHSLQRYVFEPHSAIQVAKLTSTLAAKLELGILDSKPLLMTCDQSRITPFASCFEVIGTCSANASKLKRDIEKLQPGQVEFKCRSPYDEIPKIRNRLRLDGDQTLTVFAVRLAGKSTVILCHRIVNDPSATETERK